VADPKTITVTYSQGWSIISGLAVGIFVLSMIFFRFLAMEIAITTLEEREIKKHNRQQEQIDYLIGQSTP
jgi:CBS domain containing-hemolysin-like protein